MAVKVTKTYRVTGPITLENLRTLVNSTGHAPGTAKVTLQASQGNQFDYSPEVLTLSYEEIS
jgi:hypothetical protein